ncbi:MAG TPA: CaiB/BaiF CoA-transferase family protein [Syntrophorhabdaceae bacterium]|nr:CaiB/BaiF CoA-transferase family protein [Syntrophorhabdaceae bacterium]
MKKILSGVRILDFTDALAGPFCTRYLADCGCEVISIEKPGGKMNRSIPFFFKGQGIDYIFNHCAKKSIVIDLKNSQAHDLIMKLAKVCDVVVENFRPGTMKGFNLDYDSFRTVNPSIIMCSISGWGQYGPKSELLAVDLSVQAQSGLLDLTGEPDAPPSLVGVPITDFLAGLNAFGAICAALYNRSVTGQGEYIDIAMLDCAVTMLHQAIGTHLFTNGEIESHRVGRFNSDLSPHGIYKGTDGYIAISARGQMGWKNFTDVMGRPELVDDPRFNSEKNRVKNNKEVTEIIETWLQTFEKVAEVAMLLQSYRIVAAPVLTAGQSIEDPYFEIRDMLREVDHSILGKIRVLNSPLKFRNSNASVDGPPPAKAGDHTSYVLKNILGMEREEIRELKEAGVVSGTDI